MEVLKLGDICELKYGSSLPERKRIAGPVPVYGSNGIVGYHSEGITQGKTVVVGRKGSVGEVHYSSGPCFPIDTTYFVSETKRPCDIKWLYYALRSLRLSELSKSSAIPGMNRNDAYERRILFPELTVQRQVAAILDRADAAREKRREANKLAEQFLRSTFLEMFGDPVTSANGWNRSKLGDLGKMERGRSKHRPRNAPFLLGGPYPLIQTGEIANSSGYIKEYTQTYSELGLKQSRMWPKGTLAITIAANIASTAILTFDACFPDSIVGFTPKGKVNTEYVQWWFSFIQKHLEETAPAVAQKNINLEILRNLDVPVPPLELQEKFAALVERVESLRAKQGQSAAALDSLFNSLMQKAFRGELVKETVAVVVPKRFKLSPTDIHVGLLGKIIMAHEARPEHKSTLGHVKGEKICHIIENFMDIDLERNPKRMAAGPADFPHLLKVESRAGKTGRFQTILREGAEGRRYIPQRNLEFFLNDFSSEIGDLENEVERIINLFVPMRTDQAEVVATVYAAWNDLLLGGKSPSDDEIVREARENWTSEKLRIQPESFRKSIEWLRRNGLVPRGTGKHTTT